VSSTLFFHFLGSFLGFPLPSHQVPLPPRCSSSIILFFPPRLSRGLASLSPSQWLCFFLISAALIVWVRFSRPRVFFGVLSLPPYRLASFPKKFLDPAQVLATDLTVVSISYSCLRLERWLVAQPAAACEMPGREFIFFSCPLHPLLAFPFAVLRLPSPPRFLLLLGILYSSYPLFFRYSTHLFAIYLSFALPRPALGRFL